MFARVVASQKTREESSDRSPALPEMYENETQNEQTDDGVIGRPPKTEIMSGEEGERDKRSDKAQNQGTMNESPATGNRTGARSRLSTRFHDFVRLRVG